jgi:hypothetical protein
MPPENPLAEGKVLWITCLLKKKPVVQFTLNQYRKKIEILLYREAQK